MASLNSDGGGKSGAEETLLLVWVENAEERELRVSEPSGYAYNFKKGLKDAETLYHWAQLLSLFSASHDVVPEEASESVTSNIVILTLSIYNEAVICTRRRRHNVALMAVNWTKRSRRSRLKCSVLSLLRCGCSAAVALVLFSCSRWLARFACRQMQMPL